MGSLTLKKYIAAMAAASALTLVAGPATAAYTPTTETDVKAKPKGKVKPGKKTKVVVKSGIKGDSVQCTGSYVIVYKDGAEVVRKREKAFSDKVRFNGRVPKGTDKIFVYYERGKKDPCDKSRTNVYRK